MARVISIHLNDLTDGTEYRWTVTRDRSGWLFTDHDGYTRFGGRNWLECVARVQGCANGYNLIAAIS